jgi:tRNA-2-methylthio-N6-dimethylallyladenosine synthase
MRIEPQKPSARVWIETYGCQMNKSDSELVGGILAGKGFRLTDRLEDADIAMINTCSVRSHAEQRAVGRIGVLSHWKRHAPHRQIVVLGCMAQKEKERLFDRADIDLIVGPDGYRQLPDLLADHRSALLTDLNTEETYSGLRPRRSPGICGWVTIMRGCNNFCSYCIVPYTRGRERSRPADEIESEIRDMLEEGFRDITLLGQNVNSYHDGKTDFCGLLRRLSRIKGLPRLRFMTSHPKDCSSALLKVMADESVVCPHLHLPFQSGSNRILRKMNRKYTREQYIRLIEQAKNSIPDLAVTTDVMVGFPGESDRDFRDTVDLMTTLRFDDAYLYHFSPRPGTAAEKIQDFRSEHEKLHRLNEVIALQKNITREIKLKMIGKSVTVLPEETSKQSGEEWIGKTANNHMVVFPKEHACPGQLIPVRITSCRGSTLRGCIQTPDHFSSAIEKIKIAATLQKTGI